MRYRPCSKILTTLLAVSVLFACSDGHDHGVDTTSTDEGAGELEIPSAYVFFDDEGNNTTSYAGQTMRQVCMVGMKSYIGEITGKIDNDGWTPAEGEIVENLTLFYSMSEELAEGREIPNWMMGDEPLEQHQLFYSDFPSIKSLSGKIAGNDSGSHKDWATEFEGWDHSEITSPESLVLHWFAQIEAAAIARANGEIPLDPTGAPISSVYLTADGTDLQQLLQKFLMGAVSFSQGTDDYMDEGLTKSNATKEGKNYSDLAHAWDEGYGYFGAAVDYLDYTDDEIAGKGGRPEYSNGYHDTNGDGKIDLLSELNFGHAVNAAKRDRKDSGTDFTTEAGTAFIHGRAIIAAAGEELTDDEMAALVEQRDIAVWAWEKAIAGTALHYIKDVQGDMAAFGSNDYSFSDHAKHWSELKGFSLSLQFSPHSPMTDAQFTELQGLIGTAPVLPNAEQAAIDAYAANLDAAIELLQTAYGFSEQNIGAW
ncbi:MAG: DUF4856 domain-containing protein [Myxococcales bacterium]|nr:DUF4856 domain-containing protein [Myxococcales bacterium]|tara:strand:- start:330 stop:1772 length:1443 start_codon:yes stop_codon:yes gene_type:complete